MAVEIYLMRYEKRNLNLEPEEWVKLKCLVDLLDPLECASKQMCREDEPISIQFPVARALTSDIHAIVDPELQEIRRSLLGLIVKKFDVKYEKIHGIAMFLDPRFKDIIASNKVEFRTRIAIWIREDFRQDDFVESMQNNGKMTFS
uniref:Uncharacterized protein n=1 Tax=Ditylenchus dipsaci TaxID=166011 RepID=A0A915D1M8_9BILA